MERRTHESPMDFEWQSQGPVDPTSPFYQLTQRQAQRRGFDSPSKPEKSDQARNQQQSSFTAAPAANQPPPPFRNPSFVTPRKPFDPDLFSEASGADSSPADNADGEDTPDVPKPSKEVMTAFTSGRSERKPIFGKYGLNFTGNTPGRGELRRGRYGDTITQKVRKRKRLERDYALIHNRRGSWDSETESDAGRPQHRDGRRHASGHSEAGQSQQQPGSKGWFSDMLSGIESRPTLPYVLSYYAQLILNWFVVLFVIYLVWNFFLTIRADVDKASETAAAEVLAEMAHCAAQYTENRCGKDMRVPAMETMCQNWEICMNKDPTKVGRARISAHTFAEIFNSFVEPISWKAMVFVVLILTICLAVNNIAFGLFRAKATHPPQAPGPHYYPVPPTPQHHHPSQEFGGWISQTPMHPALNQGHEMYGHSVDMAAPFPSIMPAKTPGQPQRSPRKGSYH